MSRCPFDLVLTLYFLHVNYYVAFNYFALNLKRL